MDLKRILFTLGTAGGVVLGGFFGYRTWALKTGAALIKEGSPTFARGRQRLLRAHKLGSDRAAYLLGMAYWDGMGCPKDPKEAVNWFTQASDAGDLDATATLGLALRNGTGIEKDEKKGQEYIKKAAEEKQPKAMALLASDLLMGTHGEKEDPQGAFRLAKEAAAKEDPKGMLLLGKMLVTNAAPEFALVKGSQGTPEEGFRWVERAANAGDYEACFIIGAANIAMSDTDAAHFIAGMMLGDIPYPADFGSAVGTTASLNPNGKYLARDVKKAEAYLLKAVSGFPKGPGELLFRKLYQDKAINPASNPALARGVLEQLSTTGDSWAPGRLGFAYMDGEPELGISKDPKKAAEFFRIGEKRGDRDSARVLKIFRDAEARANEPFRVERLGVYNIMDFPRIQGLIRNISDRPHNARVTIGLLSPTGTLIDTFTKTVFGIPPNQAGEIDIAIAPYHRNARAELRKLEWQ